MPRRGESRRRCLRRSNLASRVLAELNRAGRMPNSMRRADLLVQPDLQPYLSRLSGAGSLRRELEAVLDVAPVQTELEQYRKLILEMNAPGKPSAPLPPRAL